MTGHDEATVGVIVESDTRHSLHQYAHRTTGVTYSMALSCAVTSLLRMPPPGLCCPFILHGTEAGYPGPGKV